MAFDKDPAAMVANIAVRYPLGVWTRTRFPSAGFPGIRVAVPAMVPGNPHMIATGRPPPALESNVGWGDANHDFASRRAEHQSSCENKPDQTSTKHNSSFPLVVGNKPALLEWNPERGSKQKRAVTHGRGYGA